MEVLFDKPTSLAGQLQVPGSKSYTHRAYLTAALLGGGQVKHPLQSEDTSATRLVLQGFNCEFSETENGLEITKSGGKLIRTDRFLAGESGTLLRFLLPVCTVCPGPEKVTITGRGTLEERSNKVVINSVKENGFEIKASGENATVPITCFPGQDLPDIPVKVAASTTSQLLSGWLLALAASGGGEIKLTTSLVSAPYVEMTAEVLSAAGVEVSSSDESYYKVQPKNICELDYTVPGDYSAAAFLIVGGALAGDRIKLKGLHSDSRQADSQIVEFITELGAEIQREEDALVVEGPFQPPGFEIDASDCPDLVPILTVLGSQATEPVTITNIGHLANKESDRLNTTCRELEKIGLKITAGEDKIKIAPNRSELHSDPVTLKAHNDHRLAMAFSILGICRGNVKITGAEAVSKSYPDFFTDMADLNAKFQQK